MKRKYARMSDPREDISDMSQCTKKNCKWQGTDEMKLTRDHEDSYSELICPKCGNNEFYSLLK